jgi:hypothetical protein
MGHVFELSAEEFGKCCGARCDRQTTYPHDVISSVCNGTRFGEIE